MPSPKSICSELDQFLDIGSFKDASLNGLQLDAGGEVQRIATAVSANAAAIEAAAAMGAQLLVVHHGWLWGRCERLTGLFGARVRACYDAGLSLGAYHLPLDAHPAVGNNAGLADLLDLQQRRPFALYAGTSIGFAGLLPEPTSFGALVERLGAGLGAVNHAFGDPERMVQSVGLCSGGSANTIEEAASEDLDVFITGEAEEWTQAQALELGIGFIAGGHHRTERFGPQGLAEHLRSRGYDAQFIDVPTPV